MNKRTKIFSIKNSSVNFFNIRIVSLPGRFFSSEPFLVGRSKEAAETMAISASSARSR